MELILEWESEELFRHKVQSLFIQSSCQAVFTKKRNAELMVTQQAEYQRLKKLQEQVPIIYLALPQSNEEAFSTL